MQDLAGKRLVIFGCGYVGSAVAVRALEGGLQVTALTRNESTARRLRERGVETVCALLADDAWHRRISPGADLVLNSVSAFDPTAAGYRISYVDGARSILEWASRGRKPIDTLVYTSSTGVYPQGEGVVVDETAAVAGATPSGEILLEAERIFREAAKESVRRTMVLRLAGIYGPGRHSLLDQLKAGAGTINGRGDHRLNLVHRDDVVNAVMAAFAAGPSVGSEVFNVSDGRPAPKSEVVGWLAQKLQRGMPAFDTAAPSIRRGGAGVPDRVIRSDKIRELLGWSPMHPDFRDGYRGILDQL